MTRILRPLYFERPRKQKGVVLMIALIALIVLSLAGIAMMRSVDTGNVIAGNMSIRQAALMASDSGVEAGFARINATILGADRENNFPAGAPYYYATMQAADASGRPLVLTAAPTCIGAAQTASSFDVLDANNNPTGFCNIIVIERMCMQTGPATLTTCIMPAAGGNAQGGGGQHGPKIPPAPTPFYRVTVRIDGPLNTKVYTQGFLSTT